MVATFGQPVRRFGGPRVAADAQLQAQLPITWSWGALRPYVGVGYGGFTYRRLPDRLTGVRPRVAGSSRLATLGLRLDIRRRWGVHGEMRIRDDAPSYSDLGVEGETSVGLTYRF